MSARTEANKLQKFISKMRTDLNLFQKSPIIPKYEVEALQEEIADILVQGNLNYPRIIKKYGIDQDTKLKDKKIILENKHNSNILSEHQLKFIKFMEDGQTKSHQSKWRFRIAQEAIEKHENGWYPFFITLTVDPILIDSKEMWQKGTQWQSLVRRLSKIVTDELNLPPYWKKDYRRDRYAKITEYLTYAAIIEHGKSREHHHLHAIVWFKDIPSKWKLCPNRNCSPKYSIHNRCSELETYWTLQDGTAIGRCEVNYFRSVGDIWEIKHAFKLPLKDGKAMKVAPVTYAGAYLTKYLQKELKEWNHRMKATRNLGLNSLKTMIKQMKPIQVEALTWRPETSKLLHSVNSTHSVPLGLIRQIAKQVHFYNLYRLNQLDLKKQMSRQSKPFIQMLRSAQHGVRPERMPFGVYYDWLNQFLPAQQGYCEEGLLTVHQELAKKFKRTIAKSTPIKIPANQLIH